MAEKAERERNMAPNMFKRDRCVKIGTLLYQLEVPDDQSCVVLTPTRAGEWLLEEPLQGIFDAIPHLAWREPPAALIRAVRETTSIMCDGRHEEHFAATPSREVFSLCRLSAIHREISLRRIAPLARPSGTTILACEGVRGLGFLIQRSDKHVPRGAVDLW